MNKSFSAWSVLVLGLLMIAFLAGCGGVSANTPPPKPTPTPSPSPNPSPTPTPAADGTFLYAGLSSGQTAGYRLNPDGSLSPLANSPFAVSGGVAAAGNFLAVSSANTVSAYSVDPASGSLSLTGTGNVVQGGPMAADGRNIYVAGNIPASNSTGIYGFAISGNGVLTALAGSPYTFTSACDLCDAPFDLALNNNFLVQGGTGFHGVGDFTVYPRGAGGVLGTAQILGTNALESVAIQHPTGNFAYALDTSDALLSQFSISPAGQATQTAVQARPEFPQTLIVDTSGKFVLSVDSAGIVHVFAIAPATGNVSEIGRSDSAGVNPGALTMDPGGHFVFVATAANPNSTGSVNQITVFTFDPGTGVMKKLQTFPQPAAPGSMAVIVR